MSPIKREIEHVFDEILSSIQSLARLIFEERIISISRLKLVVFKAS